MTRRKEKKRPLYARPIPLLAFAAAIGFGAWFVFGETGLWQTHRLRRLRRAQAEQIQLLEARKRHLQQYLAALKAGDERALERAARELGFTAPDETIYEVKIEKR